MRLFELASGLKVIFLRVALELLGWRAIERCANVLNCKVLTLPFIYLGLLIGANHRRVETWQPIIQKFTKKLSLWKHKNVSFGGRICLINSVFSSLPLFYLSFFKMPKEVWRKIVVMMRIKKIAWWDGKIFVKVRRRVGLEWKNWIYSMMFSWPSENGTYFIKRIVCGVKFLLLSMGVGMV